MEVYSSWLRGSSAKGIGCNSAWVRIPPLPSAVWRSGYLDSFIGCSSVVQFHLPQFYVVGGEIGRRAKLWFWFLWVRIPPFNLLVS